MLAPFAHGLWSAILGGVIFHAARKGHVRLTWSVVAAYLGVAILHGAFDAFGSIASYIVIAIVGVVPVVYLWLRADRGMPLRRQTPTVKVPA